MSAMHHHEMTDAEHLWAEELGQLLSDIMDDIGVEKTLAIVAQATGRTCVAARIEGITPRDISDICKINHAHGLKEGAAKVDATIKARAH